MTSEAGEAPSPDDTIRATAVTWLARLRAPDSADHHEGFEAWYAADPRHADIYDEVLASWENMALAAQTPAAEPARRQTARAADRRPSAMAFAAAAAVLLVIFAGIGMSRPDGPWPGPVEPTEIASRLGEIRTTTLSDGSRVTLDTDSLLLVAYPAGERRLLLRRGRARFDVAHDTARQFVVQSDGGLIIAHGTLFDVEQQARRMTVSLLRGSVEVRTAVTWTGETIGKGRLLRPGQQLALEPQTPAGSPVPLRESDMRWTSGMLSFEDAPLAQVVAATNRYNDQQIRLADPKLGALRFTGTFAATKPRELAQMLAATFNLDVALTDRGPLILSRRR